MSVKAQGGRRCGRLPPLSCKGGGLRCEKSSTHQDQNRNAKAEPWALKLRGFHGDRLV